MSKPKPTSTITCREFIEFVIDYVDDQLSKDRRQIFDAHLAVCPECVAYLDSYQKTVELEKLAFAQDDDLPSDLPDELVRAILDSKKS